MSMTSVARSFFTAELSGNLHNKKRLTRSRERELLFKGLMGAGLGLTLIHTLNPNPNPNPSPNPR